MKSGIQGVGLTKDDINKNKHIFSSLSFDFPEENNNNNNFIVENPRSINSNPNLFNYNPLNPSNQVFSNLPWDSIEQNNDRNDPYNKNNNIPNPSYKSINSVNISENYYTPSDKDKNNLKDIKRINTHNENNNIFNNNNSNSFDRDIEDLGNTVGSAVIGMAVSKMIEDPNDIRNVNISTIKRVNTGCENTVDSAVIGMAVSNIVDLRKDKDYLANKNSLDDIPMTQSISVNIGGPNNQSINQGDRIIYQGGLCDSPNKNNMRITHISPDKSNDSSIKNVSYLDYDSQRNLLL